MPSADSGAFEPRIFWDRLLLIGLAVAVTASGVLVMWYFVLDTTARRRLTASQIQSMIMDARKHSDDPRYAKKMVEIARGNYSFGATMATSALGEIGAAAVPVIDELADLIESPNKFVAREAALSLAKLGPLSESALDALVQKVEHGDPGQDATAFSALALGKIGKPAQGCLPLLRSKLGKNEIFDDCLHEAIKLLETQ